MEIILLIFSIAGFLTLPLYLLNLLFGRFLNFYPKVQLAILAAGIAYGLVIAGFLFTGWYLRDGMGVRMAFVAAYFFLGFAIAQAGRIRMPFVGMLLKGTALLLTLAGFYFLILYVIGSAITSVGSFLFAERSEDDTLRAERLNGTYYYEVYGYSTHGSHDDLIPDKPGRGIRVYKSYWCFPMVSKKVQEMYFDNSDYDLGNIAVKMDAKNPRLALIYLNNKLMVAHTLWE